MPVIPVEFAQQLNETLEDVVEYTIAEWAEEGILVSGETAWKLIAAYANTQEAVFAGRIS